LAHWVLDGSEKRVEVKIGKDRKDPVRIVAVFALDVDGLHRYGEDREKAIYKLELTFADLVVLLQVMEVLYAANRAVNLEAASLVMLDDALLAADWRDGVADGAASEN
jgi:hypothetical protein